MLRVENPVGFSFLVKKMKDQEQNLHNGITKGFALVEGAVYQTEQAGFVQVLKCIRIGPSVLFHHLQTGQDIPADVDAVGRGIFQGHPLSRVIRALDQDYNCP